MDVSTFQGLYPVFKKTSSTQIAGAIARASRMISPQVWGAQADDGVGLLAAHYLQTDPAGTNTALKADGKSLYWDQYDAMRRAVVGGGFAVAGGAARGWYGGGGYIP